MKFLFDNKAPCCDGTQCVLSVSTSIRYVILIFVTYTRGMATIVFFSSEKQSNSEFLCSDFVLAF
jgi:hypothetical protein